MKYLLAVLLLLGCSLPAVSAEPAAKKKAAASKAESKTEEPSAKAVAAVKTLTPLQKTKLLDLLNKGDSKALQSLPGVGESRAQGILKARPFADPVDIVKVDGIGEGTLVDIVAYAKAGFPANAKKAEPVKKKAAKE